MPSRATHGGPFSRRSGAAESMKHPGSERHRAGLSSPSAREPTGTPARPYESRAGAGPRAWAELLLSVLGSALLVAAVGCFCALLYPILKELRGERVRREDGTEERMLGFWSILVLSAFAGCVCCALSWTLTYLNSYSPDRAFPTPLSLLRCRDAAGRGFHLNYGVALLNGVVAALAVVWSLS